MWIFEDDNKLLYFISENFDYKPNVAIFSFNKTLIKDVISRDKIKFMQLNSNVLARLQEINTVGSIVIIESCLRVSKANLKLAVKRFYDLLENETNNIPFIVIFTLASNKFKKPYTHVFSKLESIYLANEKEIILEKSIVVGNAAGRLQTSIFAADLTDHDRAFACNIGIAFKTPEQIFSTNSITRQWAWHNNNINKFLTNQPTEPAFSNIFSAEINTDLVIFITGSPTSGKTLLGNRIKNYIKNVTIYDINNYTNRDVMITALKNATGNIIVIDTMESELKRNPYFNLFTNIYYIEMSVKKQVCEFLNMFRLQISKNIYELHPRYTYASYYNYYKPVSKEHELKIFSFIKFPLVIRERKELFFHY